eukprot:1503583-Rhodomonas_salina.1
MSAKLVAAATSAEVGALGAQMGAELVGREADWVPGHWKQPSLAGCAARTSRYPRGHSDSRHRVTPSAACSSQTEPLMAGE